MSVTFQTKQGVLVCPSRRFKVKKAQSYLVLFRFINRSNIQGSDLTSNSEQAELRPKTEDQGSRDERQDHVCVTCFALQRFLFRVVAIDNLILKFPPPSLDETLNRVAGAFTQPPPKATTAFEPWNFEA